MEIHEIAKELTLKALESKAILLKAPSDGKPDEVNSFNAKQIAKFYQDMFNVVNNVADHTD